MLGASERYKRGSTNMRLHSPFPRSCSVFVGRSEELRRALTLLPSEPLCLVYGIAGIGKSEFVYQLVEQALLLPSLSSLRPLLVCVQPGQRGSALVSQLVRTIEEASGSCLPLPSPDAVVRGSGIEPVSELRQLVQLLEQPTQPYLLCLDELHVLEEGADFELSTLLGYLSRHVRRSRIVACLRSELELPPSCAIPVVIRLPPLSPLESSQLVEQLCLRLGHSGSHPDVRETMDSGSPLVIRQALFHTASPTGHLVDGLPSSGVDTLSVLTASQRQLLLLARIYSGSRAVTIKDLHDLFPSLHTLSEDLRVLSRRFLIDLDVGVARGPTSNPNRSLTRAKIILAEPLWNVLLSVWPDADLQKTRREVASLLLGRFFVAPQRSAQEGIEALKQLVVAESYTQAVQVLRQIHRTISAAWLDAQLLELLDDLRGKLADGDSEELRQHRLEVEFLTARLLRSRSQISAARMVLSSLGFAADVAESSRYLALLGEVCQRSGRMDLAQKHLELALVRAESPRERLRTQLQLAQTLSLSGDRTRARQLIEALRTDPELEAPAERARWSGALSLVLILEDRLLEAAQVAQEALSLLGGGTFCLDWALHALIAHIASDSLDAAQSVIDQILFQALTSGVAQQELSSDAVPLLALMRGVMAGAKGELTASRALLSESLQALLLHGDQLAATVVSFYLARVLLKLGDLSGSLTTLERAIASAREAGTWPLVQRLEVLSAQVLMAQVQPSAAKLALLRVMRPDASAPSPRLLSLSQGLLARLDALSSIDSPLRESEMQAAAQAMTLVMQSARALEPAAQHLLELEHAELWLQMGRLPDMGFVTLRRRMQQTLGYYAASHRHYEEARAALSLSWLLLSLGQPSDLPEADEALGRAQELSTRHAYGLLHLRGLLLESSLQRRQGNGRRALLLLKQGVDELGSLGDTLEARLLRGALQELGHPSEESTERSAQLTWLLSSLGLRSVLPYELLTRAGRKEADEEARQAALFAHELLIEPERGSITRGGEPSGPAIVGRPLLSQLLSQLLFAPTEGASAERLFYEVWGGRDYHPLQHRNTIYVAIGRLRQALRELLPGRELIETAPGGWRLIDSVSVCVVRRNSRDRTSGDRGLSERAAG